MKYIITLIICLLMMIPTAFCMAEGDEQVNESETESVEAEFDLSNEQQKIKELGIPTVSSVEALKIEADALWEKKDYENAASAYSNYAKQANWLANIISAALEPFYDASYDDRKYFNPENWMVEAEQKANAYKAERNRAMLYEGLCYYYLNDYETALPRLIKALDIIEIEDEDNWNLGMEALYAIVGYQSTDK